MVIIPEYRLNALFSILSQREITDRVREAVRAVVIHGHSISMVSRRTGVSRNSIHCAMARLDEIDSLLAKIYRNHDVQE